MHLLRASTRSLEQEASWASLISQLGSYSSNLKPTALVKPLRSANSSASHCARPAEILGEDFVSGQRRLGRAFLTLYPSSKVHLYLVNLGVHSPELAFQRSDRLLEPFFNTVRKKSSAF